MSKAWGRIIETDDTPNTMDGLHLYFYSKKGGDTDDTLHIDSEEHDIGIF